MRLLLVSLKSFLGENATEMSSQMKFKSHSFPDPEGKNFTKNRVKLTDLVSRLNEDKKKERNSNIVLSVAVVSAVAVFGIILSI